MKAMYKAAARMYKRSAGTELVTMKKIGTYTARKHTKTDLIVGDSALLDQEKEVRVEKIYNNSALTIDYRNDRRVYSLDRLKKTNQDGRPS